MVISSCIFVHYKVYVFDLAWSFKTPKSWIWDEHLLLYYPSGESQTGISYAKTDG